MAEILHQLIDSLSMFIPLFTRFHTSQVVQDFSHQQYHQVYLPFRRWLESRDEKRRDFAFSVSHVIIAVIFGGHHFFVLILYANKNINNVVEHMKLKVVKYSNSFWEVIMSSLQCSLSGMCFLEPAEERSVLALQWKKSWAICHKYETQWKHKRFSILLPNLHFRGSMLIFWGCNWCSLGDDLGALYGRCYRFTDLWLYERPPKPPTIRNSFTRTLVLDTIMKLSGTIGVTQKTMAFDTHVCQMFEFEGIHPASSYRHEMKPPKTFTKSVPKIQDIMHKMNTPQGFESERQLRTMTKTMTERWPFILSESLQTHPHREPKMASLLVRNYSIHFHCCCSCCYFFFCCCLLCCFRFYFFNHLLISCPRTPNPQER